MPEWAASAVVTIVTLIGAGMMRLLWQINARLAGLVVTVSDHDKSITEIKNYLWSNRSPRSSA